MRKNKQLKWDKTFLKIAKLVSEHSTCIKIKVGAILVKDKRIISIGFNGVPSGEIHCEDVFSNINKESFIDEHFKFQQKEEIHAEVNCISFSAKHGIETNNTTLYCTLTPCRDCAKLIIQSGIKRVVYSEKYRDLSGIEKLKKSGIKTKLIKV